MDRGPGRRTVLSLVVVLTAWAGGLSAQGPSAGASASPLTTATPWVQASSPARPSRADKSPAANPTVIPSQETARVMAFKREEELVRQAPLQKPVPPRLLQPRTPEENAAYERNLALWSALPPEEKKEIRGVVAERIREETEKAYASSGLNLNPDQREVFVLRYRQERRRMEREIQEKAAAERTRRMPEIMDRLRHEFGPGISPAGNLKPTPKP